MYSTLTLNLPLLPFAALYTLSVLVVALLPFAALVASSGFFH
jgi:hypothetical protein